MTSITLFAGMIWGIAAPATKEPPKKEIETSPIVGSWKVEKMTIAGMDFPATALVFEFTADGKLIKHDEKGADRRGSTYMVDSAKTPGELDWLLAGKKEQTLKGIFTIDGDTLTICIEDGFDSKRPDKFESLAGTKRMLWKLTRTSKKN